MAVVQVGKVESANYEPIPTGTKLEVSVFDISKVQVKTGENAGKDQLDVTVKVTEEGQYFGREIRYNKLPLYAGKSAWALTAFAEAVGWPTSKDEQGHTLIDMPDNLQDVLGTKFIAKIGQTASNKNNPETGEPYINNRLTGYGKLGSGGAKPAAAKPTWGSV